MGWYTRANRIFDAATRWLNSKVSIRPSTRRIYQQLLVGYLILYFGGRTLRLLQVTDIECFRTELSGYFDRTLAMLRVFSLAQCRMFVCISASNQPPDCWSEQPAMTDSVARGVAVRQKTSSSNPDAFATTPRLSLTTIKSSEARFVTSARDSSTARPAC